MTRVDICAADDFETIDRLLAVIAEAGGVGDEGYSESSLGVGLTRFRFGTDEVTLFRDAWVVDFHGPDELAARLFAALRER